MQTITRNDMTPSTYQTAIFNAVADSNNRNDIVVSAVAGSGKSTTLKLLLDYISPVLSILYCCFNSDAQKSLQAKIVEYTATKTARGEETPVAECSTIHSLGNRTITMAIGKCQIKSNKYSTLVRQYLMSHMAEYDSQLAQQISKLIDMVRLTLANVDEDGLRYVISRFEIDINPGDKEYWPLVLSCVPEVLKAGLEVAKINHEIDFTDMIYLPHALNLAPKTYDYVLVDEAQDLSPAQRELVLKARRHGGRMIFVGDRSQAIYGFAGASLRSIDEIVEATNAVEMPLSICYRCPKKVIEKANSIYPGTEAAPNAEEGVLDYITSDKVADLVGAGDLILCRLTAPLVTMCLQFLREGKRANVRGKDLGSQFTSLLNAMEKKYKHQFHIDMLVEIAREYERWQISLLSINAEENEMKIASLQDKIDTLIALYEAYKARHNGSSTIDGFKSYIDAFFAEDPGAQIILSTGHRAKGLEYRRVFILQWDALPHPKAKTQDQLIQEHNLMYVMVTRAQEALYLVVSHVAVVEPEPELLPEDEEPEIVTAIKAYAESVLDNLVLISPERNIVESTLAEMPLQITETVNNAPEVVETVDNTSTTKRPYGGRKALDESDKRVLFQQTWDPSIREAFKMFVALENHSTDNNISEADMLEMVLLGKVHFASFFNGSQYKQDYEARLERAEQRREDYKNRKRKKG